MRPPRTPLKAILAITAVSFLLLAVNGWHVHDSDAPVEKIHELHGKLDTEVFELLGNPSHEYSFTMDESVGELRIELLNTYPPDSPSNSEIEIRECTWENPHYRLTVWFHKLGGKWVALDSCRYKNGIVF